MVEERGCYTGHTVPLTCSGGSRQRHPDRKMFVPFTCCPSGIQQMFKGEEIERLLTQLGIAMKRTASRQLRHLPLDVLHPS